MLTTECLRQILDRAGGLSIGVVGDLFLDRYLDIDASLTEPSVETGLDAYQVVRVRASPGAAGTIINNLVALGVGRVVPVAVIGDDGEGYELRQCLGSLPTVDARYVFSDGRLRTPTYVKPMLHEKGAGNDDSASAGRELNRLDIKNRKALPREAEDRVLMAMGDAWAGFDAVIVQDQVSEPDCGVVTARVRQKLAELGDDQPAKLVLADSRERVGLFRSVAAKPNERECLAACPMAGDAEAAARELAERLGRPVFCTRGDKGIHVIDRRAGREQATTVPAYAVDGPIDIVGAGDSCSAAIACAVASGVDLVTAAAFGNLVASITIQQIGTTGTASPAQVMERWRMVSGKSA
jgi:rfaE bifunctional protein kinase chain/domain